MAKLLQTIVLAAAAVTEVKASCAYGTHLSPRAEGGVVPVNTFGYSGEIVSSIHSRNLEHSLGMTTLSSRPTKKKRKEKKREQRRLTTSTRQQGPAMWHSMNMTTNSACAKGTNQSPIDLVSGTYKEQDGCGYKINLPDFSHGATFENLGTTVEIVGDGGNLTLPSSNKTFEFAQFHFHLPSEHLENGTSMAMEAHFVFQAADAEIAVLGVYMDVGSDVSSPASQVFETVLGSVGDIATPGTATTTPEISMAGINDLFANTVFKT